MSDAKAVEAQHKGGFLLNIDQTPPCPRCSALTQMVVRFPYSWKNGRGEDVRGMKEAVLCAVCDREDPAAAELMALFAIDETVAPDNLETLGALAASWAETVRQRTVDENLLAAEYEHWRREDL
ncbi:hypothetical protein KVH22_34430 [Streptomyces olivaceus]|uniref:DUF6300 family protein n=1 Tax=Streptomyces olivaceus TaxID=47716 RepID=UPI001CCF1384|nr:DUF6300 family protein [Streptomyces olivaceus]MBZ6260615.1 hypothetical protein [Streptomyces olivaceus]